MSKYGTDFSRVVQDVSKRTAREVAPLVVRLVQPKRVVDVGCGLGTWLSAFSECGVPGVFGIDGDWVDRNSLEIPQDCFMALDLKKPFQLEDEYDLVVCLEVAEHLPADCAATLVGSLTRLGPIVLFSAAIPFQGGVEHVNEQWPGYWACIFQDKGYVAVDCLRSRLWHNDNVEYFYAQNMLLFVNRNCLDRFPELKEEAERTDIGQLPLVHPKAYLYAIQRSSTFRHMLKSLPSAAKKAVLRRLMRKA